MSTILTNSEQTMLNNLARNNSFFTSLLNQYTRYGNLSEKQYQCLARKMTKKKMMNGSNQEFPAFTVKQELHISGTILKTELITYKKTEQRNFQWQTVEESFTVLYVKDSNNFIFNIPLSYKKLQAMENQLIAGNSISLIAKFKKIYNGMITVNYSKKFQF